MHCSHVVKSKCDQGHVLSWRCSTGKPAACRPCEREQHAKEKKLHEEFERQHRREQERLQHAAQIAKLDEELRLIKEAHADKLEGKEMENTLKQKKQDLENARNLAERLSQLAIEKEKSSTTITPSSEAKTASVIHRKTEENSGKPCTAIMEGLEQKIYPPEQTQSVSEREWERQKQMDNVSNDSVDSLMKMTGLEQVKAQVLKIKARIDTTLRQKTDMEKERFGIVLLGNPGTGKYMAAVHSR